MKTDFPIISHIEIRDGHARLVGRELKVKMVAGRVVHGKCSIESTMEQYGLTRAQVYACLAYYYDHEDSFAAYDADMAALMAQHAEPLEATKERMRKRLKHTQGEAQDPPTQQ